MKPYNPLNLCQNNSNPSLVNITVLDNFAYEAGGGINCYYSNPSLVNITVLDNFAYGAGGGINCAYSNPSLINVTVSGNSTQQFGGGIQIYLSNPTLQNVTISDNSANDAGGINCNHSSPNLENITITGNTAARYGGGIFCYDDSSPSLVNITITDNNAESCGGGIYCSDNSIPSLVNVTISSNSAQYGGGIYCWDNSSVNFDPVDRCNVFLNFAGSGCDLYTNDSTIDVIVDTFTVLQPDDYFAYPIDNFTFDILNAKLEQVDQDLYVSPDGSDNNSGLTVDDPLLTISYALTKISASSTNPLTIYLSNGTYSRSGTGERFALNCKSYVSLVGEDETSTILDAEGLSRILFCENDNDFSLENMTIQNGNSVGKGGGIKCNYSSPSLENVTITGNSSGWAGGGINCDQSSPILLNVTITNNSADFGGGIDCNDNSSPSLMNVAISDNWANYHGGGICCTGLSNPSLINVNITNNTASEHGGGINCYDNSSPILVNVTISDNSAGLNGGGICGAIADPILINCIMWNDSPEEIVIWTGSVIVTYSNIQGGWEGNGNIDEDPLFVGTGDHPFMLQDLSPCVNAGIPDTTGLNLPEYDLAGNPRIYGGRIDMGAYENQNVVVDADEDLFPLVTKLYQNYPNPFNPKTTISFQLSADSDLNDVELMIYNIKGQKIKDLPVILSLSKDKGLSQVVWEGTDANNQPVSSGIYLYKLKAGKEVQTKKMILLK